MFSYYGSKSKIAKHYPAPGRDTIVEPFAGSAQYSVLYPEKQVILIEKHKPVAELWRWLIHDASPSDVLRLPVFGPKERIDMAAGPERTLVAFESNMGTETPRNVAGNFNRWHKNGRQRIANLLPKIKHWVVIEGDYLLDSPDVDATWFVDPPYQFGGHEYTECGRGFDYSACRSFCESMMGQLIVCEASPASWMDFTPLIEQRGQRFSRQEVVLLRGFDK